MNIRFLHLLILSSCFSVQSYCQLPDGFNIDPVVEGIDEVGGIRFLNDSVSLLWSMDGRIFVMLNNEFEESPILDIKDEVGRWGDHAMLGFAVHPQFNLNGYIYLLYPVDQYHLLHSEDPDYDPNANSHYAASLGRLTRFQLETEYPHSLIPDSRTILIGSEMGNGIPQMSASHGTGSLEFGSDGSLLVSAGDGSTWVGAFNGGPPYPQYAFDESGMALGILSPDQNVGSFRAQYLDSYNGKILRINPITGDGLESNPFYDPERPEAQRSKVWALGLRNPFRFIPRPGTGSSLISEGDPGTLFIGDVGYYRWEEINVADGPAMNFGWPQFEGMLTSPDFGEVFTDHPYYENPISCVHPSYRFQDLIINSNADHIYAWPNPCDNTVLIPDTVNRFVHERPVVAYSNQATENEFDVLVPTFNAEGEPTAQPVEQLPGFSESPFTGISSIGGDFYFGASFPEEYFGAYFQSDYSGWVKAFWFDENNQLVDFKHFTSDLGPIVSTRFNPYDECMYLTSGFPSIIYKMCYGGNVKPDAVIIADTIYGPSPLTVFLDGGTSSDADADPMSYFWNLGDGSTSTSVALSHTFEAPNADPISYPISLLVTDTAGNSDIAEIIIALNNTPPIVSISSLQDSSLYSTTITTVVVLEADVHDQEFPDSELTYEWQTVQHHNSHSHSNPFDNAHESSAVFEPAGCEGFATYYYTVSLLVTDPGGLTGFDEVTILPDCDGADDPSLTFGEFVLYPNPSNGSFTIRGPLTVDDQYSIKIIDSLGRTVNESEHTVDTYGRIGLDLESINTGHYLVRLGGHGRTNTFPLLIGPYE